MTHSVIVSGVKSGLGITIGLDKSPLVMATSPTMPILEIIKRIKPTTFRKFIMGYPHIDSVEHSISE